MSSPAPPPITSPFVADLEEVRTWLEKMVKAVRFVEMIAAVLALVGRMRDINLELTKKLVDMRRARPKSETMRRLERQLVLPFMTVSVTPAPPADSNGRDEPKNKSRKGKHPGRAALPAHLERVDVPNPVPPDKRICPLCGAEMKTVGHSVCEGLDVRPASIFVSRRLDETVACANDDTIVSAEPPPQIVERGKLGDTLIVEALADKYVDHQPIERQARHFQRCGVDLAPQTLGRSVAAAIDLLAPVATSIATNARASRLLATDATGLPVLDEDHPDGIRNGTMWCWVGDHRWVSFFYAPNGNAQSVKDFLGPNLRRTVQCDGTNITAFLERAGGKRPGCWAHGRRRLVACAKSGDALALVPLRMIRRLFAVERLSALHGEPPEQRLRRRAEHSAHAIAELRAWVDEQRPAIPPSTPLGKAIGYLHRQWTRLILFLTDGEIELTNNRVERELRALVLGRKNWLFAAGDLGGKRTATILSIVATCIAHRVNPRAYLHAVTKLIVNGWPQTRLRELLPDKIVAWKPEIRLPERPALALPAAP
jgi:transposase